MELARAPRCRCRRGGGGGAVPRRARDGRRVDRMSAALVWPGRAVRRAPLSAPGSALARAPAVDAPDHGRGAGRELDLAVGLCVEDGPKGGAHPAQGRAGRGSSCRPITGWPRGSRRWTPCAARFRARRAGEGRDYNDAVLALCAANGSSPRCARCRPPRCLGRAIAGVTVSADHRMFATRRTRGGDGDSSRTGGDLPARSAVAADRSEELRPAVQASGRSPGRARRRSAGLVCAGPTSRSNHSVVNPANGAVAARTRRGVQNAIAAGGGSSPRRPDRDQNPPPRAQSRAILVSTPSMLERSTCISTHRASNPVVGAAEVVAGDVEGLRAVLPRSA